MPSLFRTGLMLPPSPPVAYPTPRMEALLKTFHLKKQALKAGNQRSFNKYYKRQQNRTRRENHYSDLGFIALATYSKRLMANPYTKSIKLAGDHIPNCQLTLYPFLRWVHSVWTSLTHCHCSEQAAMARCTMTTHFVWEAFPGTRVFLDASKIRFCLDVGCIKL